MIELAPETACILYLAIGLAAASGIWLATRKKEVLSFSLQSRTCEFCRHTYIEDAEKPLSRCPECNLLTK